MNYLDFNLKIGPRIDENQYRVSARTTSGEASGNFIWKEGSRPESWKWSSVKEFGEKLFRSLFAEEIYAAYFSSYNEAVRQGNGLRVKLTVDAPELWNEPWEFLFDPHNGRFLCLFAETPIIRYVERLPPIPALTIAPPLRILAVASNPKDYESLDVEHEKSNLTQALKDAQGAGLVELDWLPHATLDDLRKQLGRRTYHILHFIGHGEFDPKEEDGILIFEDETGYSHRVHGEHLAVDLGNHRPLRLVTLNACKSARASERDPFAGMARALVHTGNLPAVVAMQFVMSDFAAIRFSEGFYSSIANSNRVEEAVSVGRRTIMTHSNVEWGTPVLYLRAKDGIIFRRKKQGKRQALGHTEQTVEIPSELDQAPRKFYTENLIGGKSYLEEALSGRTEDEPKDLADFDVSQITCTLKERKPGRISCAADFIEPALQSEHLFIIGAKGDGKTFLNRQLEFWARSIHRRWIVVNWNSFVSLFEEEQRSLQLILKSFIQDLGTTLEHDTRFPEVSQVKKLTESLSWREQLLPLKKLLCEKGINGIFISVDNFDKYPEFFEKQALEFLLKCILRPEITEEAPRCYLRLFMEKTTYQNVNTVQRLWMDFGTIDLSWNNLQKQRILSLRAEAIQSAEAPDIPEIELEGLAQNALNLRESILQLKKYYEKEVLKYSMVSAEWES